MKFTFFFLIAALFLFLCSCAVSSVGVSASPAAGENFPTQEYGGTADPTIAAPPSGDEIRYYGSFSTEIVTKTENRNTNLLLAAKAIDGFVLAPGDTFSFNKTVGARTSRKGYKEAIVFIDSDEEMELGGGVCQIATTLYNAALDAGLEIVERTKHGMDVDYVEPGRDATVYFGKIDFKFKNTLEHTVKIEVDVSDEYVEARLVSDS